MGWEPPESRHFLEKLYYEDARNCYDVVDIHPYVHPVRQGINALQRSVDEARAVMLKYGDSRPIWLGEIGWSTALNAFDVPSITEEQQAQWVTAVFTTLKEPDKIFWYNFKNTGTDPQDEEQNFGLLHYDMTSKPAYKAFSDLSVPLP
jgi:exo-beta-1,3-glucanase (GH17 family)